MRGDVPPSATAGLVDGSGLGRRAAGGALWSSVGTFGSQVLQFGASLVLARLLLPADFGLLASVMAFTGFVVLFFELGMGLGLVQNQDLREEDLSTVFWLNALGGLLFAAVVSACGPLLAGFYDQPSLVVLAPAVGLDFAVNVGVVQLALLQRQLRFKAVALLELGSGCAGFGVALGLASAGVGASSLALGAAAQSAVTSVVLWILVPWRPQHFIVRSSIPRIWKFSGGMLGSSAVGYWTRAADKVLVGRFVGVARLGFYSRASNLTALPADTTISVVGTVVFPVLAAMQGDLPRSARAYRRALRATTALTSPALVGASVVAPSLIPTLYGARWQPAAPILTLLCLAGVAQALAASATWIFSAQGRTGLMFRIDLVAALVTLSALGVGLRWGTSGVAAGLLVASWMIVTPRVWFGCRLIGLRLVDVVSDAARTLGPCAVMGVVLWLLPELTSLNRESVRCLLVQVAAGVLIYATGLALVHRSLVRDLTQLGRAAWPRPT